MQQSGTVKPPRTIFLRAPEGSRRAMLYRDRRHAGQKLAELLGAYAGRPEVIVLALPRGGVPVGYEIATRLGVPLDVFVVRKLGAPQQPELALGAIAAGGVRVLDAELVRALGITLETVEAIVQRETQELDRRERLYRGERPPPELRGNTVILVDDGLATGASMRSAVLAVRKLQPAKVVVAVPVAAEQSCAEFRALADEVLCAATPRPFHAVGEWYEEFSQTTDDDVRE